MLPRLKTQGPQEPSTWHGSDGRFTAHYLSRFYQDNSMKKAYKTTQAYSKYFEKEHFFNQEIDKIERNKFVLKNISKEKEKFDKIRKRVLTEKRIIEKKIKHAAVMIQKNIRGYLCRKHHMAEMEELKTAKLGISMRSMRRYVGQCCVYLADNIVEASIVIQKHIRRHQAMKLLKDMKRNDKAARVITRFFRVIKNRSKFHKNMEVLIWKKKVKDLKKRVKWNRFKAWWKAHRLQFKVLKRKMRSRNSSYYKKTLSRSRMGSHDELPRSRKSSTLLLHMHDHGIMDKIIKSHHQSIDAGIPHFLEAPGEKIDVIDKIDEVPIEESITLTIDANLFNPDTTKTLDEILSKPNEEDEEVVNDEIDENFSSVEYYEGDEEEGDDEEMEDENEAHGEGERQGEGQEIQEGDADMQEHELEEDMGVEKDDKAPKKKEEETEKPIPSHRRPTAAYNSWKKKPPSPEAPPREIYPPPRHLLVWTKCRKIYKNQTKKYRKKIPLWKPPLTAHEVEIRKLPRIIKKPIRIPEFLEPYTFIAPSETPDSPIKLNNDEEKENFSVDSDTSYEYEPAEYRSTGLSVALPQLYSIVKSYGKNADLLMRNPKRTSSIG